MDWTIFFKIGVKCALKFLPSPAAAAYELFTVLKDFYDGNYAGGLVSGAFSLVSFGFKDMYKDCAKSVGKAAAVNSAKEMGKAFKLEIGKKTAEEIAKGGSKDILVNAAKVAAKKAEKDIGRRLAKELATGMVDHLTEEAIKRSAIEGIARGVFMGLLASGGKNITAEMAEEAFFNFLNELSLKSSTGIIMTSTAWAANEAIEQAAKDYMKKEFVCETVKCAALGTVKLIS